MHAKYIEAIKNLLHEIGMQAADLEKFVTSQGEKAKQLAPTVEKLEQVSLMLVDRQKVLVEVEQRLATAKAAFQQFKEIAKS